AKEEGAGQFYYGVISGKGPNITFNMNSLDGFEKPATKNIVLKNYLRDEADMKFKPVYEIVTELPDTPVDEGPEGEEIEASPETVPEPEVPEATLAAEETAPEPAPPPPEESPEAPVDTTAAKQLTAALAKLSPVITKAVVAQPARKAEILGQVADIKQAIRTGETDTAKSQLLETGRLVKELAAGAPGNVEAPEVPTEDNAETQWQTLFAKLEPRYLEALKLQPANASQMRTVMGYASEQAGAGQYAKAIKAIKRLAGMIQEAMPEETVPEGDGGPEEIKVSFVAMQKSRLAWDGARKTVAAELRKLEQAILEACREEPDFEEIANRTQQLYRILDTLDERLLDKLDDALNAQEQELRSSIHREAQGLIREYLTFVDSDPLILEVDTNPFTPVAVKKTMTATLSKLSVALT
ncbi:MAG: hypothetical protein GY731_14785, partial [Gammaproteobacteria bacterium]|nr:hypothetical protein [Gammaproteobacteria bacterium]